MLRAGEGGIDAEGEGGIDDCDCDDCDDDILDPYRRRRNERRLVARSPAYTRRDSEYFNTAAGTTTFTLNSLEHSWELDDERGQ